MISFQEFKHLKRLLLKAGWIHEYSVMDAYGTGGGLYTKNGQEFWWNKDRTKDDILQLISPTEEN